MPHTCDSKRHTHRLDNATFPHHCAKLLPDMSRLQILSVAISLTDPLRARFPPAMRIHRLRLETPSQSAPQQRCHDSTCLPRILPDMLRETPWSPILRSLRSSFFILSPCCTSRQCSWGPLKGGGVGRWQGLELKRGDFIEVEVSQYPLPTVCKSSAPRIRRSMR